MRVCDECGGRFQGVAVTIKWSYPSRLFDGETHEFCSDECYLRWGARQATRYLKLRENAYAELDDKTLTIHQRESLGMMRELERREKEKEARR
jgi:hypothetical protein